MNSPATHSSSDTITLGFWTYLMTDCVLFATFFVTYVVLRNNNFGGPTTHDIFNMPYVLVETFILLTSSFTCGLATLAMQRGDIKQIYTWFSVTLVLGLSFLAMEITEFVNLIHDHKGPTQSAFLSSYFSLVGLHGLHIAVGSLWVIFGMIHLKKRGLTASTQQKLTSMSLFWHFLDLIWIFIFAIVYLMGVM